MKFNSEYRWSGELRTSWPVEFLDKGLLLGVWFQQMANRLVMGCYRYDHGKPIRKAEYLKRLMMEVVEYIRTGNREHLLNAANYCFLESVAPQHPGHHHETEVESVTRRSMRL